MKNVFKILKFINPYFSNIIFNSLFNFLSVIFSLFSISLIIPILGLLFGTIEASTIPSEDISISNLKESLYYYINTILDENGVASALGFICGLVAVGTILKNTSRYLALYFLTPMRNNVIRDIRKKLYTKLLHLPLKDINNFKKGDIVARMTHDLHEIEWSIMGVLELFIKDPIHILIFLITLLYISPQLTLVGLVFLPITAIIIVQISKSLKRSSLKSQNKIGELISIIEQSITNIKIIKVFSNSPFISNNFNTHNEQLKKINNKVLWRKDLASPMSEMLSTLVLVIIIWFGGNIVLNTDLAPDSFIGFLAIFSQILPPAKSLTSAFYSIQKGSAAIERVLVILESENEINKSLHDVGKFNNTIEFEQISFSYKNDINISNVNLTINKGDKIGVVGESGSGKSTLIELLLNFYTISTGDIKIDGQSISQINNRPLFALVTQETMLFNDTVRNNLLIGNHNASEEEIEKATKSALIHKVIMSLEKGYNTIIGPQGNNLSGGERQRIGIARALLSGAPILILDEPTSSLDSESNIYINEALNNLEKDKTVIIVSHKLSFLKNYNKIIVMQNGKIIEEGSHNFLIKYNGIYKQLYDNEINTKNENY